MDIDTDEFIYRNADNIEVELFAYNPAKYATVADAGEDVISLGCNFMGYSGYRDTLDAVRILAGNIAPEKPVAFACVVTKNGEKTTMEC